MKIVLFYFSGTGNTKRIATIIAQYFQELNDDIILHSIEEPYFVNLEEVDVIGLAYPIHAFNTPEIMTDFVKNLPISNTQKRVFILTTSGEPLRLNEAASSHVIHILKKKKYLVTNEYHYVMPYNIIFRHSEAMAYRMLEAAKKALKFDVLEIHNGIEKRFKINILQKVTRNILSIEHPGAKVIGRTFKVKSSCIMCKKCINNCPQKNIVIKENKIQFKSHCILCMRCVFYCPVSAIECGILKRWKVNGPYKFNEPNNHTQLRHKNWCKKSYNKYFSEIEKK